MSTYGILKDFLGPAATFFAAASAILVTCYFSRIQAEIAEAQKNIAAAQRDIAADKLKHDLFGKRYEIYCAARSLIKSARQYSYEKPPSEKIVDLKVKLDEARFFFPKDIQALAREIESTCEAVMTQIDERTHQTPNDSVAWSASAVQVTEGQAKLQRLFGELSARFERDLGFDQLTRDPNEFL